MEPFAIIGPGRTRNHQWFFIVWTLSLIAFQAPLLVLVNLSFQNDQYSHILLVPLIAGALIYSQRQKIFTEARFSPSWGAPLLLLGIVLAYSLQGSILSQDSSDKLPIEILAVVFVWIGEFVMCYGTRSFRAGCFPLLFLLLMIPLPAVVLDNITFALQKGSADITYALFKLLGVPVLRQGFTFALPGVQIEIAKECSGIRSSIAFFITSILAAHLFLRSTWRRICLVLFVAPVVIFKNAVRIVTISWLGVYVDHGFLVGRLHRYGGLPFSLVSLAILVLLLLVLQKGEIERQPAADADDSATPPAISPRPETV